VQIGNNILCNFNKNLNAQDNTPIFKIQEQKESKSDTFNKNNAIKSKKSSCLIFFQGKFEKIAKNLGKGLFTRGDNCYKKALAYINQKPDVNSQEFKTQFEKPMQEALNCFESSLPKLRVILKDDEFAMKVNYVGTVYTYLGNLTRDPFYYSRAQELFDEAVTIATRLSLKDQLNLKMFTSNKQSVYAVLNPTAKKEPIGFRYPENKQQE